MTMPFAYRKQEPMNAKLVTKTSLPNPKRAIGFLIALWYAGGKPGSIDYGRERAPKNDGSFLDDMTLGLICSYGDKHLVSLNREAIRGALTTNELCVSQIESLNAGFELIWRLASFRFTDTSLNLSAERSITKGAAEPQRYRKRIAFTTNLDLVDAMVGDSEDEFAKLLFNWMTGGNVPCDKELEARLVRMLTVFSEPALFRTGKGDSGKVYVQGGIYAALLDGNKDVAVSMPDAVGPTRILKKALPAGLNCMLAYKNDTVNIADGVDPDVLEAYSNRAGAGIRLMNVKCHEDITKSETDVARDVIDDDMPRNLIFFGAPGTGKSYELRLRADKHFDSDNVSRVTFYPDYTYAQFVGCYKPFPKLDEDSNPTGEITYDFVPGPFLRTYVKAVQNPDQNYLLIVEEINRANPAAVFGDVFQLLDRDKDGRSVYEIAVPEEMKLYFQVRIPEYHKIVSHETDGGRADYKAFHEESIRFEEETRRISLPPNMYIWATMNSADQGVFPMDTAFKRRWSFEYIDIDAGANVISAFDVRVGNRRVNWDRLRQSINDLMTAAKINEDKLLGPFFVSPDLLNDEDFAPAFKDKVLLYLYEDAGKMKRSQIFADGVAKTYSSMCSAFDERGVEIFNFRDVDGIYADTLDASDEELDLSEE